MSKVIVFDDDARKGIANGISKAAEVVASTIGPRGNNVVLEGTITPTIVNDGITVLKEIELEDKLENIGVSLVREAANKTNDSAGDGTSGTTILTDAILKKGIKAVSAGANGILIKKGIDKAVKQVVDYLKKKAIPVDDNSKIKDIATISANSSEIGQFIADAMDKVGKDGVVTLEDSKTAETYVDVVEGLQFKQGMLSTYFADDQVKVESTMENPTIVLINDDVKTLQDIIPVLEKIVNLNKPTLMVVDNVSQEILAMCVINKLRGSLNINIVKAPGYGNDKKEQLKDLAAFTGATLIDAETGTKLKDATADMFGSAKKVIITKDKTTIMQGNGTKEAIDNRYNMIKEQCNKAGISEYEKAKLQERMAKLKGAIAVLYVGGNTETEQKELKLRVEDALNSTLSAIDEGIVGGCGSALFNAKLNLNDTEFENEDIKIGYNIVKESLDRPLYQIVKNSGLNADLVIAQISELPIGQKDDYGNVVEFYGIDASINSDVFFNLVEKGIVDPVKVIRSEIQNSSSIAGMILTSNSAIFEVPEEKTCDCCK